MAKTLDLTKIPATKKNRVWVALSPSSNKIVGYAKSLEQVLGVAKRAKVSNPTVFKIGPFSSSFVGLAE